MVVIDGKTYVPYEMVLSSGIICPECKVNYSEVYDSRECDKGQVRRRECKLCGMRWKTIEVML